MVAADRAGFDAHGIFRLESYLARIRAGGLNLTPNITIAAQSPAPAVVDGDDGMGHLVAQYAPRPAIGKTRTVPL